MASNSILSSSIGRKFAMALSALFLLIFLLQHLIINCMSLVSREAFNSVSEFMGTNPLIQFLMQPILFFGVIFHFIMGFYLELKNKSSRGDVGYAYNNAKANSSWTSRNMIWSGLAILSFLFLHLIHFFFPTIQAHYICHEHLDAFDKVKEVFSSPLYVAFYCLSFFFLAMHLQHGFTSAFQSVGFRHKKYTPTVQKIGTIYAYVIPLAYAAIAIFHFINKA